MNNDEKIILTDKQRRAWEDTNAMMGWRAPGFRHLWYKLLSETHNNNGSEYTAVMTKDMPNLAATDGKNVLVNPDRFFELSIAERVFVGAHEVMHNVRDDVRFLHQCVRSNRVPMMDGSYLPFKNDTLQKAMDASINAVLIESKIGKPPEEGWFDPEVSGETSFLDTYKKYWEQDKEGDGAKAITRVGSIP